MRWLVLSNLSGSIGSVGPMLTGAPHIIALFPFSLTAGVDCVALYSVDELECFVGGTRALF